MAIDTNFVTVPYAALLSQGDRVISIEQLSNGVAIS